MHPEWPARRAKGMSTRIPYKRIIWEGKKKGSVSPKLSFLCNVTLYKVFMSYHPVQAKKSSCPKSFRSLAKLNINVYINTVGSATPSMSRGCPPTIEWITPQIAVDARVCTAVKVPSVKINTYILLSKLTRNKTTKWEEKLRYCSTCISFQLLPERYNWNCWSKEYVCCRGQDPKWKKILWELH